MTERRHYPKPVKLAAVMAAEVGGVTEAGKRTGIPKTTIQYWLTRPEFAQFRTKTREEMADEIRVVAHLAWKRVAEALQSGEMEPRDALFAADKASSLQLLMAGEATTRAETRTLLDAYDDEEKQALGRAIDAELERVRAEAAGQPQAAAVGSAGQNGSGPLPTPSED